MLTLLKLLFIFSLVFGATDIVLAQQLEEHRVLDENYYFQKGLDSENNGNIEWAISFYEKALEIQPDFQDAKISLENVLRKFKLESGVRTPPVECLSSDQYLETNISIKCAEEYFIFKGKPIHPKIIQALTTWLSY